MLISVLCVVTAQAQHGLAFYHLKDATFQNTNYNPAYFPTGKVFIGLPVISGVNVYLNNRFSFNDLFAKDESGNTEIAINNTIDELGIQNIISANVHISLLHLGIRIPDGGAFSFFVNERIETDITYPRKFFQWVWEGNANFIGRKMDFGGFGISANYFREYGLGVAYKAPRSRYALGLRAKYYQGLVNVSTPASLDIKAQTENENYQLNFETENAIVRTAGIQTLTDSDADQVGYLISNGNRGFGIDFGFEYTLNRYYQFAFSANDVGFISWKEGIENYEFSDTTFRYAGIDLETNKDILGTLTDSLLNPIEDHLDTVVSSYTTPMVSRFTGSLVFTPMQGVDVITTVSSRIVQFQPKMSYGVGVRGYLGPKLIGSASITKLPQQFFNIGAAFAVGAGPVQLYASADKVIGYSIPDMQWMEFRVGLNMVFGNRRRSESERRDSRNQYKDLGVTETEPKGVTTNTFMGHDVKVKRQEGLYTIVNKQERSEARTITPDVINDDHPHYGIRSESGKGDNSRSHNRKIRSASGTVDTGLGGGRKARSATGTVNTSAGKKKKILSASGANQSRYKRKSAPRSASGSTKNFKKKKRRRRG